MAQYNYYNFEFCVQDVVLMGRAPHKRALDRDNAEDYNIVAEALETAGSPRELLTQDFIREVYEVSARIMDDLDGLHILFHPGASGRDPS